MRRQDEVQSYSVEYIYILHSVTILQKMYFVMQYHYSYGQNSESQLGEKRLSRTQFDCGIWDKLLSRVLSLGELSNVMWVFDKGAV